MSKKAVLVGINYFNTSAQLFGCINDIVNIKNVLVNQYGYLDKDIVSLRDDSTTTSLRPTRINIMTQLTQLIRNSSSCSEIWFHYSGHGSQIRDQNGDEQDGLDEVIVPSDYMVGGLITDDEIFNIVKDSKCKTMLIFDSCHSGSVCDMQWQFEFVDGSFMKKLNSSKKIINPNVISISGCRDPQTSADAYDNESKQSIGAYTNTMIKCLKNNNYNTTILKLYSDICVAIKASGFEQCPVLSCSSVVPNYKFESVTLKPVSATTTSSTTITSPTVNTTSVTTVASPIKKDFTNLQNYMNEFGQKPVQKDTIVTGNLDVVFNLSNTQRRNVSMRMKFL
jgi:hypothetical protein